MSNLIQFYIRLNVCTKIQRKNMFNKVQVETWVWQEFVVWNLLPFTKITYIYFFFSEITSTQMFNLLLNMRKNSIFATTVFIFYAKIATRQIVFFNCPINFVYGFQIRLNFVLKMITVTIGTPGGMCFQLHLELRKFNCFPFQLPAWPKL